MLIEEFLRFVDLGCQVRAATAIGVVKKHQLTVLLADLVLVQSTFPIHSVKLYPKSARDNTFETYGSSRINAASRRFIRGSNPLYASQLSTLKFHLYTDVAYPL